MAQTEHDFEIIIIDGGSADATSAIARALGAKVLVQDGCPEFAARNIGAKFSKGQNLVFTCADAVFPPSALQRLDSDLSKSSQLDAVTGPDFPYDGDLGLRVTYSWYNLLRYLASRMPYPLKRFSTSTNFLVVRRIAFDGIGGFKLNDVNADGNMGRSLAASYHVLFDNGIRVFVSARRAKAFGLSRFVVHYFYVLENFFPGLCSRQWFQRLKANSFRKHRQIHAASSNIN